MATSTKTPRERQREIKSSIKKLKQSGLYGGDLRKQPTRYAKSLTRKFADVLEGRAKVVSVPKTGGSRAARREAREIADQFGEIMRAKSNKLIVRVSHPQETVGYSHQQKKVFTQIRRGSKKETHEYIKVENGRLPTLERDQAYGLPVRRMGGELGYIMRATEAEILALANEYENRPRHMYKGATGHIQIVYGGNLRRSRKRKLPKASNVIPFPGGKK